VSTPTQTTIALGIKFNNPARPEGSTPKRGDVALRPCMHPVGEWACSLPEGHEGLHES
jgi:hypothetical protein